MSAIKIYFNDSLGIVMWDHRPPGRFAPHDEICDILRAAIKSRISADMLSLRIWYFVIIHITYSLLHTCNFFQMLMQINRSNWGHLQKGALCPMLLESMYVRQSSVCLPVMSHRSLYMSYRVLGRVSIYFSRCVVHCANHILLIPSVLLLVLYPST